MKKILKFVEHRETSVSRLPIVNQCSVHVSSSPTTKSIRVFRNQVGDGQYVSDLPLH